MNITCPNCHTIFVASKEQIGAKARKVKCSKCQYIWHQKLEPDSYHSTPAQEKLQNYTPVNTTISISSNEPNKISANKFDNFIYSPKHANLPALLPVKASQPSHILSISLINLIFLLIFILFHDKLSIFTLSKFHDNKVIIENIHTQLMTDIDQLKISYRVTNNDNYNIITIPLTRIRILNQQHLPIKTYILDQKNIKLLPHQHIDINTTLNTIPSFGRSLDIMLGNNLDFILQ